MLANILRHGLGIFGGQPNVGVFFVDMTGVMTVVMMMAFFQVKPLGSICDVLNAVKGIVQEILKTSASDHNQFCLFNGFHLICLKAVVMQTRYTFGNQSADGNAGVLAKVLCKCVYRQCGANNFGVIG